MDTRPIRAKSPKKRVKRKKKKKTGAVPQGTALSAVRSTRPESVPDKEVDRPRSARTGLRRSEKAELYSQRRKEALVRVRDRRRQREKAGEVIVKFLKPRIQRMTSLRASQDGGNALNLIENDYDSTFDPLTSPEKLRAMEGENEYESSFDMISSPEKSSPYKMRIPPTSDCEYASSFESASSPEKVPRGAWYTSDQQTVPTIVEQSPESESMKQRNSILLKRHTAAIDIQRLVRGRLARMTYSKMKKTRGKGKLKRKKRKKKAKDKPDLAKAAANIQRVVRGYQSRIRVSRIKESRRRIASEHSELQDINVLEIETNVPVIEPSTCTSDFDDTLPYELHFGGIADTRDFHPNRDKEECIAATRIQKHVRGRSVRRAIQAGHEKKERSAVQIQRIVRGKVARQLVDELRKERASAIRIQARIRGQLARTSVCRIRQKKAQVEKERYTAEIMRKEHEAVLQAKEWSATRIQAVYRGRSSRKSVLMMRQRREEAMELQKRAAVQDQAALRIQTTYRGRAARRSVAMLINAKRNQQAVAVREANDIALKAQAQVAATRIQSVYRGRAVRKTVEQRQKLEQATEQEKAALRIQTTYRGRAARRSVSMLRNAKRNQQAVTVREANDIALKAQAQVAATRIQSVYRGRAVRKTAEQRQEAAVCIQTTYRGRAARQSVAVVRAARRRERQAATHIQAAYRGRIDRKLVGRKRAEKYRFEQQILRRAAIRVQKVFRGHMVRHSQQRNHVAAIQIQKMVRGHRARKKMQRCKEKHAAMEIQRIVRGNAERRVQNGRKKSAARIQSIVRGRRDRKRVESIKRRRRAIEVQEKNQAAIQIQAVARGQIGRRKYAARKRKNKQRVRFAEESNRTKQIIRSSERREFQELEMDSSSSEESDKEDFDNEEIQRSSSAVKIQGQIRVFLVRVSIMDGLRFFLARHRREQRRQARELSSPIEPPTLIEVESDDSGTEESESDSDEEINISMMNNTEVDVSDALKSDVDAEFVADVNFSSSEEDIDVVMNMGDSPADNGGKWDKLFDSESNKSYYYNKETGETQWEQPDDFVRTNWGLKRQQSIRMESFGDWEELQDVETGGSFYYNKVSGLSQWEIPESVRLHRENEERRWKLRRQNSITTGTNGLWQRQLDPTCNKSFYYNSQTGESTWEKPSTSSNWTGEEQQEEWSRYRDKDANKSFYYNNKTGESEWVADEEEATTYAIQIDDADDYQF